MTVPGQMLRFPADDLRRQAVGAARWTGLSSAATVVLQFVQLAVLGRLLGPEAFGLMAIVAIVVSLAQLFGEMGLSDAVVQRKDPTRDELSSLYWTNVFFSGVLFLGVLAAAPLVARAFGQPELADLLPAAAVSFLIMGFGLQFRALAQKALHFRLIAAAEIAAAAVALVVSVSSAWLFEQGVWSLVWGQLGAAAAGTAILAWQGWRAAHSRPRLRFRRADLAGYLSFGLYRTGSMTVNFFNLRVAQLFVGALLGAQALGYYSVATNLVLQPVQKINPVLTRVAFPVFSRVQDDQARQRRGYLEMIRLLMFVSAPIFVGAAIIAPTAVPLLLGEQWTEAVPLVQVLAFYALLRSLGNAGGSLLMARGRSNWGFYWNLALLLVIPPVVYLASRGGNVLHVALSLVVVQALLFLFHYRMFVRNLIGPCFASYLRAAGVPVLLAGGMGLVVLGVGTALVDLPDATRFGVQVLVGVASYASLVALFQRRMFRDATKLVRVRG